MFSGIPTKLRLKSGVNKLPSAHLTPAVIRKRQWDSFTTKGQISHSLRPEIARSWRRCQKRWGLDPRAHNIATVLPQAKFADLCRENNDILGLAENQLSLLLSNIKHLDITVGVQHKDGAVLYLKGAKSFLNFLGKFRVREGSNVVEKKIGTSAMSVCISEKKPAIVVGEEHYTEELHKMQGMAVPVFVKEKELWGCLFLITRHTKQNEKLAPLLVQNLESAAEFIRLEMKIRGLLEKVQLEEVALNAMKEAVALIDPAGNVSQANKAFFDMIGQPPKDIAGFHYSNFTAFLAQEQLSERCRLNVTLLTKHGPEDREVEVLPVQGVSDTETSTVLRFEAKATRVLRYRQGNESIVQEGFIGTSHAFRRAIHIAKVTAESRSNILLQGETGTGKELFSRYIHQQSGRSEKPFIPVNCPAIPYQLAESELFGYEPWAFTGANPKGQLGKFELADGGTLFLDEVNSLDVTIQKKLLRAIESRKIERLGGSTQRPINVRIIAASSANLREDVTHGRFLPELLYRINAITINIPPLRDRKEDIDLLAKYFLSEFATELNKRVIFIDQETLETMECYDWPGNVRELRNAIQYAVTMTDGNTIEYCDLPEEIMLPERNKRPVRRLRHETQAKETETILKAISQARGNMSKAASLLGISRSTLYRKLKEYDI